MLDHEDGDSFWVLSLITRHPLLALAFLVIACACWFGGCGSVTSEADASGAAGAGGAAASADSSVVGGNAQGGSGGGDRSGAGGGAGRGGSGAAGMGGAAACTSAAVALTAGTVVCDCGGTCGGCPVANAPTCGGGGLGHSNWSGCTVNGAAYVGCAQAPDGGALGYCCANDCSTALCATAPTSAPSARPPGT
jgi:hypothetical protein